MQFTIFFRIQGRYLFTPLRDLSRRNKRVLPFRVRLFIHEIRSEEISRARMKKKEKKEKETAAHYRGLKASFVKSR